MESHSFSKTCSNLTPDTLAANSSSKHFQADKLDSAKTRIAIGDSLLNLSYSELSDSECFRHLRHGFTDEEDFEDFKQDLVDIHKLRTEWKRNRRKVSATRVRSQLTPSVLETLEENPRSSNVMDFFKNDDDFQEFDRVFETLKSNRLSNAHERYRTSPQFQNGEEDDVDDRYDDLDETDVEVFDDLKVDDVFSDFFDHDEDFKAFEAEFQNFKKCRSKALGEKFRNSVCDLIDDLKAFCDRESGSSNSTKSGAETSSLNNNSSTSLRLWSSGGGEWDYIFDKIRQHGSNVSESSGTGKSHLTTFCGSDLDLPQSVGAKSAGDNGYNSFVPDKKNEESSIFSNKTDCQLTCHHKCRPLVTLDCKSISQDLADNVDEGMELFADEEQTLFTSSPSIELASEPSTEKDETDSGYRSGTIPEEKLPPKPSQATLNREELKKRITEFNKIVPGANFALKDPSGEAFQGFLKVTLNLVRPINMSLGARPPSIYEILTQEHIVEQNTQNISFYMPRDTVKSIHVVSNATTKEVITALLKKFNILDHPRKFAMYEQELVNKKIAKLRRVGDKECPLQVCLSWDSENLANHRLVLQENETGEIVWDAFSFPELSNFLKVLDREQEECTNQLIYKYKVMRRIILQRMKELRKEQEQQNRKSSVMRDASVT
ncbi:hypothetical protein ACJMK2_016924 [Sinanodonta woodiana]|uniref:Ras association domain-containing protein 1 n=3 Tax=Sinanodonta woodiana TaxID=1069815 RepID=A0ABD3UWI4_SINWO